MNLLKVTNEVIEELRKYNEIMISTVDTYEELRYYEGCSEICKAVLRRLSQEIDLLDYVLEDELHELELAKIYCDYAEIRYREGIIDTIKAMLGVNEKV